MITEIHVQNFKLFRNETAFVGLNRVNLLTGVNGRGKSTFLQTLLLPAQSVSANRNTTQFLLNGEYLQLGRSLEVRNENLDYESCIEFGYKIDGIFVKYELSLNTASHQTLKIRKLEIDGDAHNSIENPESLVNLLPDIDLSKLFGFDKIQFVSAERIGPRMYYEIPNRMTVGAMGEYAPSVMHLSKDKIMPDDYFEALDLVFPGAGEDVGKSLSDQVEYWMSKMFGDTKLQPSLVEDVNLVSLKIRTEGHDGFNYPTNVGYGYSYVLPIIVAGLVANANSMLIVENPEAHLHPSAQSILGRFLAVIASCGVQVFVETHSEHVLNAFRVMAIQDSFSADSVNVLFFDERAEPGFTQIAMSKDGKLDKWPEKFFDQAEIDLRLIVGF